MAFTSEKTANFASFVGTPDSDTTYNTVEFGFKAIAVKIIVAAGTLDVSLNKTELHMTLPVGQYDFVGLEVDKLHVRDVSASGANVIAWTR